MATVRGSFSVILVPAPCLESISILPPIGSTADFTASIPTPLPDMSETTLAVLKPGIHVMRSASFVLIPAASSGVINPLFIAAFLSLSGSIPFPSSDISIKTWSFSLDAFIRILAGRGLPAARLSSGNSMPWSTAFLIICIRGFPSPSIMERSSSMSCPSRSRVTSFPSFLARSRTILGNLSIKLSIGIILTFIT